MRKLAVLLLAAGWAWPAMAAKYVNVGQLEQLLDSLHGKSDAKVAGELWDLELTERVTAARLAHWETEFLGSRTHEALIKLTDMAAFLDPPAADVTPIAAPDLQTQERMLVLAAEYVKSAKARLPNFLATRKTTHFEDTASTDAMGMSRDYAMGARGKPVLMMPECAAGNTAYKFLHSAGTSSTQVAYRDGEEVRVADTGQGKNTGVTPGGLTTVGEFGPFLSIVMGDAVRSEVVWLRWEKGAGDPVAVFRYAVPAEQSNYQVGIPLGGKIDNVYPGYHGEIAIDPATGAILRMSAVFEMAAPYQAMKSAILVEYAPVEIGAQSYICPVHGVAFSRVPVAMDTETQQATGPMQTQMNDVVFTQYHVFRSQAQIVTDGSGDATPAPADRQP